MKRLQYLRVALVGGASMVALTHPAAAKIFNIPSGDLSTALSAYMQQSGVDIVYVGDTVRGHHSGGAKGDYTETAALSQILSGTGFTTKSMSPDAIGIVPAPGAPAPVRVAQASKPAAPLPQQTGLETVVVTAQHKSENIQTVPISVTALSQQQLTDRQIAGGPDLLKSVPNMDFTKTNFSGYNIELRGIGTQAISVTTDPAVAVAFNDMPFIRNHFFEQEFYDLSDAEVLRGPQGTLYGRNATAGVVNLKSALPTDTYEAMLSADMGNYSNRRLEAMLNLPIVGDTLDIRFAGEWTKRDGYTEDTTLNMPVDGRDLWSGRLSIGWKPASNVQTWLVWEHFSEDDDRLRSGKQLCKTAPNPTSINGIPLETPGALGVSAYDPAYYVSQGCEMTSLYSPDAFEVPNGLSLAYASAIGILDHGIAQEFDPYASTTQSTNLRDIQSAILPHYRAKNDTLEFNADWRISKALNFTSQTGYNNDFLFSTEDYNRFDTAPGFFAGSTFCDPQVGCSNRLVAEDLSDERAWQFNQEFRLASSFDGPLNFSAGGNFLHYETVENYNVFINSLTHLTENGLGSCGSLGVPQAPPQGPGAYVNPFVQHDPISDGCSYVDPNPIGNLNNLGHNYFLSQNPYVLNSYAVFGEIYYNITNDLKLTTGLRWTDDQKHFLDIPSELLEPGGGYPVTGVVNQSWERFTGRAVLDWTPQLDFTDQTLVYASYAHGYKAGGANPPGATLLTVFSSDIENPIHPLTFKPEYIEAFELGTKNTLLDGSLTLNGDIFYYNYSNYQISEIVDRTAINNNYNAHVEGAEVEANWEPLPGLKFNFAGGWEDTAAAGGDEGVDLMDRTAGMPGWMVVKPFITQASNCILPTSVVAGILNVPNFFITGNQVVVDEIAQACGNAYTLHLDPVTVLPYVQNPTDSARVYEPGSVIPYPTPYIPPGYTGFNPLSAPNNGEGFDKNLAGHALPNAPPLTVSLGAEYSMPVSEDWVATLRSDFYWQADSWARIFNDNPYDRIDGYTNVNVTLILTSANGWQVMGYVKNVFDTTAITGDFLNSDDTGLTTNVFLTDPRLYGVRVTKQLDQNDGFWGSDYSGYDFFTRLFSDTDNGKPSLWIEFGGNFDQLAAGHQLFDPPFMAAIAASHQIFNPPFTMPATSSNYGSQLTPQEAPALGLDWESKISFEPDGSDWVFSAGVRYGRAQRNTYEHRQTNFTRVFKPGYAIPSGVAKGYVIRSHHTITIGSNSYLPRYVDNKTSDSETHDILDFMAGKNVGLGMFNLPGTSVLSAGARYVAFTSKSGLNIRSDPDANDQLDSPKYLSDHRYEGSFDATRSFHGIGPALSWNASTPFLENGQSDLSFDWGANGAVLFGRQRAAGTHQTGAAHYCTEEYAAFFGRSRKPCAASGQPVTRSKELVSHYQRTKSFNRSRMVAVPNLGGFAGISWRYSNAKVSFGYRADEFFGAIDGGINTRRSENRGFFGPFANISIGLGG